MAGPAARMIQNDLPESVANAAIEFITGPLLENPQRVGKKLRGELEGRYAARRGAYRVVYRINQSSRRVVVLRVEHRAEVYRPR
ncbi:MAG: type II toxin-antitoxin system RelE/ParE family toxin [Pseudonocardiales bacterium]|nr:type II toxin-antitoxin system RelE/ParE family toxin [Pseudonocardiales bacterium]